MKKLLVVAVIIASLSAPAFAQQSLTLDAAEQGVLDGNRDIVAARVRVVEAKARLMQAGLWPNPELEVDGRFDNAFANEGEHGFGVAVLQPFSISGRIRAQEEVAQLEIESALADIADLERRTVGDVRRTFSESFAIEEQIKLQQFLIDSNEELLLATSASMERGQVSEKDVNAILIALQQARQRSKVLETQLRSRLLGLNKLMGKPADYDFALVGKLELQALPDLPSFVLEKVLERRPDFISTQLDVALARSGQRLAKAERFEDWRIGAGYEREQSVVDSAPPQAVDQFVGLKLSIPLPLFDSKQGRILETLALEDRAEKTVEALQIQIAQELADAINRVKTLKVLLDSYEPSILKRAEENIKLVEDGYRQGLISIVEVIQSRQQFAELKSSYIETLSEYQLALIDLEIASGIFPSTIQLEKPNQGKKP